MKLPPQAPPEKIFRDKTVLVIDDEPDVILTTTLMLEDAGYRVLSGATAAEALALVRSHRPAMVLLDVELPDGSGIEVAREIKFDPELADVFVVLASGKRITPQEQADGMNLGLADGYIVRPLNKSDLLARIEAFLRIRTAQALLRLKNAELEGFSYTVAHDLRSPLVSIQAFVGLLREKLADSEDAEVRDFLGYIVSDTYKMQALLDDLLKFNRIKHLAELMKQVDLNIVVAEVIEMLHGRMTGSPIEFRVMPALPVVIGNTVRLRELFQNLIENAIKYMGEQQSPVVEVGVVHSQTGSACFVRDNGQGIAPEHHEKVFGLFQRLHNDDRGTGVGLALVKRIVELHGGQIWIESAGEGKGTTFWFTFPGLSRHAAETSDG